MLLGEEAISHDLFPNIEAVIHSFEQEDFRKLSSVKQYHHVCHTLAQLVEGFPLPCFLLPACVDFIQRFNAQHIFEDPFHLSYFEFWLIHFSNYNEDQMHLLRGKIAGKHIPRTDYQRLFPIGMGKVYSGTHFVTAHLSPDADTMVASFWGWLDAFAARVSTGLNVWALPGGPPDSPVSSFLKDVFGLEVFNALGRSSRTLTLMAMDLLTQTNFIKKEGHISVSSLDHGLNEKAVILVDSDECYIGDWRPSDAELVRQVLILYKACLNWFENNLHIEMISLFANPKITLDAIPPFLKSIFEFPIGDCNPVQEFSEKQKEYLHLFLLRVFKMPKGIASTFQELFETLIQFSIPEVENFKRELYSLLRGDFFDSSGKFIENRPHIFNYFKTIISHLNQAMQFMRDFVERLDICICTKTEVLNRPPHFLTPRIDVEDIRLKMKNYDYMTVVLPDNHGKLHPLGLIWGRDLRNNMLGTVSLRDFSDLQEAKMAPYLTVISLIDHHKTNIRTFSPPLALIGDVQSCNVLVLECAFELSDRYGTGNFSLAEIDNGLKLHQEEGPPSKMRIRQRLLNKKIALSQWNENKYFIHPNRERIEYLSCLYAILDDTDLLNKVSSRDVECVANILNRLKSIQLKQEVEIIQFDHIPKDSHFPKVAAHELLKNEDMHSLYKNIYHIKEREIEELFQKSVEAFGSFFQDAKEQNGCCRISQTKLFPSNFSSFTNVANALRNYWLQSCKTIQASRSEIDLFIHMISTIPGAVDIFHSAGSQHSHQDEIWFWIPQTELALSHLAIFLSGFKNLQEINQNQPNVFVQGKHSSALMNVFKQNFSICKSYTQGREDGDTIAILQFEAGLINSRKSMISPYLPSLL